jgi:hypothetical protein
MGLIWDIMMQVPQLRGINYRKFREADSAEKRRECVFGGNSGITVQEWFEAKAVTEGPERIAYVLSVDGRGEAWLTELADGQYGFGWTDPDLLEVFPELRESQTDRDSGCEKKGFYQIFDGVEDVFAAVHLFIEEVGFSPEDTLEIVKKWRSEIPEVLTRRRA